MVALPLMVTQIGTCVFLLDMDVLFQVAQVLEHVGHKKIGS